MTSQSSKLSPATLLLIIGMANLLLAAGFASSLLFSHAGPYDWHHDLGRRLPWLLMIVLGFASSFAAERVMQRGIRQEQWTKRQLAQPRRLLRSFAVVVLNWTLIAAALLTMVMSHGPHLTASTWIFFGPLFSLMRVRSILPAEDVDPGRVIPLSISPAQPLQSERWGA